jgi:hypothetical protein
LTEVCYPSWGGLSSLLEGNPKAAAADLGLARAGTHGPPRAGVSGLTIGGQFRLRASSWRGHPSKQAPGQGGSSMGKASAQGNRRPRCAPHPSPPTRNPTWQAPTSTCGAAFCTATTAHLQGPGGGSMFAGGPCLHANLLQCKPCTRQAHVAHAQLSDLRQTALPQHALASTSSVSKRVKEGDRALHGGGGGCLHLQRVSLRSQSPDLRSVTSDTASAVISSCRPFQRAVDGGVAVVP